MHIVEPSVYLLGATALHEEGVNEFLKALGAKDWSTDAKSGTEALVEIAGRLCYKSFGTGLNKNVNRVREGNQQYIQQGLIKTHHGSVLEHGNVTIAFLNVSRVLTHELVRHRAGMAYSQESLRYVRLDDLGMYQPKVFKKEYLRVLANEVLPKDSPDDMKDGWAANVAGTLEASMDRLVREFEIWYQQTEGMLGLNKEGLSFEHKKLLTSAMRRLAPQGMATHIIATGNHRAWRHIIGMRTAPGAEEEIRDVFWLVADLLKEAFPAIYEDMFMHPATGVCEFVHEKV
jgi:thymidylate synthase (FAD)